MFAKFLKNTDGATMLEYGLIVSLVALGLITSMATLGEKSAEPIELVAETIEDATN